MSATVNFGIDLGTTNSLVAKCDNGVVEVFKNPVGHKETLPSVVGFRKERLLIGDKAREYIEKDPPNVFSTFKRKMGTSESFFVPNKGDFITPVELSALVLKELRNFIYTGEHPQSVVITIPASFDTIQSNATKQAGYDAGFKEVILLQEPIAASLAFLNKGHEPVREGRWLAYDLGGGTFDVALVTVKNGEMTVTDHEGDNFLGGLDFDNMIVEQLLVPEIQKRGIFKDLLNDLKSASGKYNALYYKLLYLAEQAKILLSNQREADVEFEMEDDSGTALELFITISQEALNSVIAPKIQETVDFARSIIERNTLQPGDINEIILIGGSTYIPLVRTMLKDELGIAVNASVDPTTAVVVGAAYFAATKPATQYSAASQESATKRALPDQLQVKVAYQKNTNEAEEYFSALITGDTNGKFYRITRQDGGFDSGLKPLQTRIEEVLKLLPNTRNVFQLRLFDSRQMPLDVDTPEIGIVQGKFSLYGQSLPHDICLEVDDPYSKTTRLELLFEKNAILPIKKRITRTISRTIAKGSNDQLLINVLEGSRYATPQSNLPIGVISIKGQDLSRDLIKGSDVELTLEITESRDLKIHAYVNIAEQEYDHVFNPTSRSVNIVRLKEEVDYLLRIAQKNMDSLIASEDFESGAGLQKAIAQLEQMSDRLRRMKEDDVTDERYQIEEQKRKISAVVDAAGKDSRVRELKEDYFDWKAITAQYIGNSNKESLKQRFDRLVADENDFLNGSEQVIRNKTDQLRDITWELRKKDLDYVAGIFIYYAHKDLKEYKDPHRIKQLIERGDGSLERKNVEELLAVIYQMYELLINKKEQESIKGTGLF
jgi:molecular chaperone DnaK